MLKNKNIVVSELNKLLSTKKRALFVDLRSEREFSLGHIPGAVNLPLLDNEQRHDVGWTYKNKSHLDALSLGLEIFSHKCKEFLSQFNKLYESAVTESRSIVLYCWRGGKRSQMVSLYLQSCGFSCSILEGGYKSYRYLVLDTLDKMVEHSYLVLHGYTGAGKTEFLSYLDSQGIGVINFEDIACHRGSAFGKIGDRRPCPSQQQFENNICRDYFRVKEQRTIVVEIEGVIGPVVIPTKLRNKIRSSPIVLIKRDFLDRSKRLVKDYCLGWQNKDLNSFTDALFLLKKRLSTQDYSTITSHAYKNNFLEITKILLEKHYDVMYKKSLKREAEKIKKQFFFPDETQMALHWIKDHVA